MRTIVITLIFLAMWGSAEACSSAVVAPKLSKEKAVMIWKHRDQTATNDCRIAHFDDGKYSYTALINSYVRVGESTLAGINEVGFGYISTATKNLAREPEDENYSYKQYSKSLMCRALCECRTVDEFEAFLASENRYPSYQSNIGVGDAEGNGAYFEIWSDGYRRYDVEGFDVRTNFSFAGRDDKRGTSIRRYKTVTEQMQNQKMFSTQDLIGYSRCFWSADKGDVIASSQPYKDLSYVVPRQSSVASVVVVCSATNPRMDVIIGHPVVGMAVPVWVAAKHNIPKCVAGRKMYDLGREYVAKAYEKQGKNYYLNKKVTTEVLKINHDIKAPKSMPKDIVKFNNKVDQIFEKHRSQMMQILQ